MDLTINLPALTHFRESSGVLMPVGRHGGNQYILRVVRPTDAAAGVLADGVGLRSPERTS